MGYFDQPKKKSILKPLFFFAVLLTLVWAIGFVVFAQKIPNQLEDQTTRTDGIVVLTGGTERLNTGLTLLSQGKADKLLISGVYRGVELEELLRISKQSPNELECCVDIGFDAVDTQGNAVEAAQWIEERRYQTLRLVTANYHMPRSLLEFSYLIPKENIIAHPVFPQTVKVDEWWRWPGTASLLIGEYNKFIMVWIRQKLDRLSTRENTP